MEQAGVQQAVKSSEAKELRIDNNIDKVKAKVRLLLRVKKQPAPVGPGYEELAGTNCLLWAGARQRDGHGQVRWRGRMVKAHRLMYAAVHGVAPAGVQVHHRCNVANCVNPAHLMTGTHQGNMDQMVAHGRAARLQGERNGQAKLTAGAVRELRALAAEGVSQRQLGRIVGAGQQHVQRILAGKEWGHIADQPRDGGAFDVPADIINGSDDE